jgi:hypothetical protein
MQQQAAAIIEKNQQVLADALQGIYTPTRQLSLDNEWPGEEEVAVDRGRNLRHGSTHHEYPKLSANDFDLGQLRQGLILLVQMYDPRWPAGQFAPPALGPPPPGTPRSLMCTACTDRRREPG